MGNPAEGILSELAILENNLTLYIDLNMVTPFDLLVTVLRIKIYIKDTRHTVTYI
jgi:hypothetical protein